MTKRETVAEESSIQNKTAKGIFWTVLEMMGRQGAAFVIQIFLARLLTPEDFGLIGMLAIFIALSNVLIDVGFQTWLLHEKAPTEREFSTVFNFNLIVSITLYILLFLAAPFVAKFYGRPILAPMLRVFGISLIMNALALVQRTQLTIKLNFKVQTIITAAPVFISGLTAIIMAFMGFGVWSLIWQQVINATVSSVLTIIVNRWRPQLVFSIKSFKKMFDYSWKLVVSTVLDTVFINVNSILIGKVFSAKMLGYFSNAQKIQEVIPRSLSSAVQKVSFPVLSRYKDDRAVLRNAFQKILLMISFLAIPVSFGLSGIGTELFSVVFGEKWLAAVPYFKIMALFASCYPIHVLNLNLLQIVGRTDRFLGLEIIKKVSGLMLTFLTLIVFKSVMALVVLDFFMNIFILFVNGYYAKDIIDYSMGRQLRDLARSFVAGGIMLLALFLYGRVAPFSMFVMLVTKILLGVVIYFIISLFLNQREITMMFEELKKMLKK